MLLTEKEYEKMKKEKSENRDVNQQLSDLKTKVEQSKHEDSDYDAEDIFEESIRFTESCFEGSMEDVADLFEEDEVNEEDRMRNVMKYAHDNDLDSLEIEDIFQEGTCCCNHNCKSCGARKKSRRRKILTITAVIGVVGVAVYLLLRGRKHE